VHTCTHTHTRTHTNTHTSLLLENVGPRVGTAFLLILLTLSTRVDKLLLLVHLRHPFGALALIFLRLCITNATLFLEAILADLETTGLRSITLCIIGLFIAGSDVLVLLDGEKKEKRQPPDNNNTTNKSEDNKRANEQHAQQKHRNIETHTHTQQTLHTHQQTNTHTHKLTSSETSS
jgi:hypothetical protein